jgi:hypothetical protein
MLYLSYQSVYLLRHRVGLDEIPHGIEARFARFTVVLDHTVVAIAAVALVVI